MIDEITNDEKKFVYPVVGIIVFIFIIAMIIIWKPSKSIVDKKINIIQENRDYADIQVERYKNILSNILIERNFEQLYQKISTAWLEENGLVSKEAAKEYLFKNYILSSSTARIVDSQVFTSNDICIFKYTVENEGNTRTVVINENAPYDYDISFEQNGINSLANRNFKYSSEGVNFDITTQYSGDNIIQYEVTVDNQSENSYMWLMNEFNAVELTLKDGSIYRATDMTSFGENSIGLPQNSKFTFKVTFNINFEKQSDISGIMFKNLYKNGATAEVMVLLNGGE